MKAILVYIDNNEIKAVKVNFECKNKNEVCDVESATSALEKVCPDRNNWCEVFAQRMDGLFVGIAVRYNFWDRKMFEQYERYNPNYSKNYTKEDALKAICEDFDIYIRVSTLDQAKEGYSLPAQRKALIERKFRTNNRKKHVEQSPTHFK